jgi:uroporphyrinogen decarboxylase
MVENCLNKLVVKTRSRVAMPIATYPGLALTGGSVRDILTNPRAQYDTQAALQDRYGQPCALTAMDLSAEAEAFGCALHSADNEVPSVVGRFVTSIEQARALPIPKVGECRTSVHLETVRLLKKLPGSPLVLGGCIGPFSLAARLVGVSEALELTLSEPELMLMALEKSTSFLGQYAAAFKAAGADGLIMAEPAAGLLSPRGMVEYSSRWIRELSAPILDGQFTLILHNCAAKLVHLPAILKTGLSTFHFGAPMDLVAALSKVPAGTV